MSKTASKTCGKAGLCVLAAVALLTGSPVSAKTVVKYWDKWGGIEGEYIKAVVDRYNKAQTRVEVRYSSVTADQIHDKFLTTTVAGAGPDIVGLWNLSIPYFVNAGLVRPLDPYLKMMGLDKRGMYPQYWKMSTFDGKVCALPITNACFGFYANTAVLQESGLDPNDYPKTFDELVAMGEKVTRRDANGKYSRVGFALNDPNWWPYIWGPSFGAQLYDEKTDTVDTAQPNLIKAYDFVSSSGKRWGPNILAMLKAGGNGTKQGALFTGKTAFEFNGSWQASYWMRANPSAKWAIHPIPAGGSRTEPWSWLESDMIFLAKTKNTDAAVDFVRFLMSDEGQQMLNLRRETFSAVRSANSPDFIKSNGNPAVAPLIQLAGGDQAEFAPKTIIWKELSDIFSTVFNDTWNQKKSATQALRDAQKPIQAAIARVTRRAKK